MKVVQQGSAAGEKWKSTREAEDTEAREQWERASLRRDIRIQLPMRMCHPCNLKSKYTDAVFKGEGLSSASWLPNHACSLPLAALLLAALAAGRRAAAAAGRRWRLLVLLLPLSGLRLGCRRLHNLCLHYCHSRRGRLSLRLSGSGCRAVAAAAGLRRVGWARAAGRSKGAGRSQETTGAVLKVRLSRGLRCLRAAQRHSGEQQLSCYCLAFGSCPCPADARSTSRLPGLPCYLLRLGCSLLCFQSPELCSPLRLGGRRRLSSSTPSRRLCRGGQQTGRRMCNHACAMQTHSHHARPVQLAGCTCPSKDLCSSATFAINAQRASTPTTATTADHAPCQPAPSQGPASSPSAPAWLPAPPPRAP